MYLLIKISLNQKNNDNPDPHQKTPSLNA